jgi:hypothetical protein
MKRLLYFLLILFSCSLLESCKGSEPKKGEDGKEEDGKKKKKPKKCKLLECRVRMTHYHEGKLVRGKRYGFFTTIFAPKDPLYGQSVPKYNRKRDPGQGKRKNW